MLEQSVCNVFNCFPSNVQLSFVLLYHLIIAKKIKNLWETCHVGVKTCHPAAAVIQLSQHEELSRIKLRFWDDSADMHPRRIRNWPVEFLTPAFICRPLPFSQATNFVPIAFAISSVLHQKMMKLPYWFGLEICPFFEYLKTSASFSSQKAWLSQQSIQSNLNVI